MSDLLEREPIDDRARRASTRLRLDVSTRPLPELRIRTRPRWMAPIVAIATVAAVVIGLIAIGTNRNDQSVGNDLDPYRWIVTELPDGWAIQLALDPFGPTDQRPQVPSDNVYATDAAPEGPVLTLSGSNTAAGVEVIPGESAFNEKNYRELTINGEPAAFADGLEDQRILYIRNDDHWMRLTSRGIDDTLLTQLAQSAVWSANGRATLPPAALTDGLQLVAAAGTDLNPILRARVFGAVSSYGVAAFGTDDTVTLSASTVDAGVRATVGLQSDLRPISIGSSSGYIGFFNVQPPDPTVVFRTLYWERDGVAFYLLGQGLSEQQMLAAANSIRPATGDEWATLIGTPVADQAPVATSPIETTSTEPRDDVRDVPIDVSVVVHTPNLETWSGTLPTGEPWSLDVSRLFDSISLSGQVDGQSAGIFGGSALPDTGTTIQGFDGAYVATADSRGSAMRIIRSNGDRYTIPLHDLPGTDGLRIAVLALPGASPEKRTELIDADGNVLQYYVEGVNYDAEGNPIT
jgi:hypothetical protein